MSHHKAVTAFRDCTGAASTLSGFYPTPHLGLVYQKQTFSVHGKGCQALERHPESPLLFFLQLFLGLNAVWFPLVSVVGSGCWNVPGRKGPHPYLCGSLCRSISSYTLRLNDVAATYQLCEVGPMPYVSRAQGIMTSYGCSVSSKTK